MGELVVGWGEEGAVGATLKGLRELERLGSLELEKIFELECVLCRVLEASDSVMARISSTHMIRRREK